MECLDPLWDADLLLMINEMKDDIVKQMSFTEDLTIAAKGSRKSVLDIENGNNLMLDLMSMSSRVWVLLKKDS